LTQVNGHAATGSDALLGGKLMNKPQIWYVIADAGRARVMRQREDAVGYVTELELEATTVHRRSRDLGTDRPGRTGESATAARHALAPRVDFHTNAKADFARELAGILNEQGAGQSFDSLVLVAPARFLKQLRERLQPRVRERILAELPKDLTKVPSVELGNHLATLLKAA
jgi:protein required for attachment to host cells